MDDERADAVIEHRRKKRSPLTTHTAKLLANALVKCPDPNAAADEMMLRGWLSVKPEWLEDREQRTGGKLPQGVKRNGTGFYVSHSSPEFSRIMADAERRGDNDLLWACKRAEREKGEVKVSSLWPGQRRN